MTVYNKQIGGEHYKQMDIQPIIFINKNNLEYAEGNVIKYICRHRFKGGREDIEKAIHYCEMICQRDYADEPNFKVGYNFVPKPDSPEPCSYTEPLSILKK